MWQLAGRTPRKPETLMNLFNRDRDTPRVPSLDDVPPSPSITTSYLPDATHVEAERQGGWAYVLLAPHVDASANPYPQHTITHGFWSAAFEAARLVSALRRE